LNEEERLAKLFRKETRDQFGPLHLLLSRWTTGVVGAVPLADPAPLYCQ
jgi:hypothetical protein